MAPRYALVLWSKSKTIGVVPEASFAKTFEADGKEIPICEGDWRMVTINEKQLEAKILRICSSKKYLESLIVTKDGEIVLHGSKPPPKELLAPKSNLLVEDIEETKPRHGLRTGNDGSGADVSSNSSRTLKSSSDCSHGCPSCCSGTLPPFPDLPDGFVSTLVSLAEYFQQFQKATAEKVGKSDKVGGPSNKSGNPNSWQWASREKVELKKGTGVWIDAIKLSKIMGHADMTKKPPHLTLVKSLLVDLLGTDTYTETTAEKIDRRLMSAVVSFTNEKYPDLAQPIERYYRCINLNRGYMQKRKSGIGFDNEDSHETTVKTRRTDGMRNPRRLSGEESHGHSRPGRRRRTSGVNKEMPSTTDSSMLTNFEDPDQLIIPLDYDNEEDISSLTSESINKIIVVPSSSRAAQSNPQSSTLSKDRVRPTPLPSASAAEVYNVMSDEEDTPFSSMEPQVKIEEDYGYIEGALEFDL